MATLRIIRSKAGLTDPMYQIATERGELEYGDFEARYIGDIIAGFEATYPYVINLISVQYPLDDDSLQAIKQYAKDRRIEYVNTKG